MSLLSRAAGFLRAPKTALAVLVFIAGYSAVGAWSDLIPGAFSSPVFLWSIALLFASTLVCTVDRTRLTYRLWKGEPAGTQVQMRAGVPFDSFLAAQHFTRRGETWFRHRHALWGGVVLHVGVLVLIAGVAVQRGFQESGAFELTEGEAANLATEGVVFGRDAGPFASATPPAVDVALVAFDPFLRQRGYSPDRGGRIVIGGSEHFLDRAAGTEAAGMTLFQAIPFGPAVNVSIGGLGIRSIHLRSRNATEASASVTTPSGKPLRFTLRSERPFSDPRGTGALTLFADDGTCSLDRIASRAPLDPSQPFDFGGAPAKLIGFAWWGGFTYSRNPGIPAVFAGFGLTLLGCLLLVFPAATAGEDWLYAKRGAEVLLDEWRSYAEGPLEPVSSVDSIIPRPLEA